MVLVKRLMPNEKRSLKVFCLDTSKQSGAMLFSHFMNVGLAFKLKQITGQGDGCVWYMMNFIMDFTIGMSLTLIFLKQLEKHVFNKRCKFLKTGHYNEGS